MRALKILGIALGGLVALIALALVAVVLFVDPNDYKDRISAAVQSSTGRALSMPGELKLSVFPWIAIETGEVSLGNPAGFGEEPFATVQRAKLRVKLLPLLRKQLEVGRIEIDGLNLALKQNAAGKGNWEEWGAEEPAAEEEGGAPSLDLAGIAITNSRVAFEDLVAQKLNVDIGRVAPGQSFPVKLALELVTAPEEKPLPLAASFDLAMDLDAQRYQLAKLQLEGQLSPEGAPQPVDWTFASPALDIDLAGQTLAEAAFEAQVAAAKVSGTIAGTKLVDAPSLTGQFALQELSPRALLPQFGIASPVTRDPTRLSKLAAQGSFAWANGEARATNLKVTLDDSQLGGRFAYHTETEAMNFALDLDRIDLDRYQAPPEEGEAGPDEPIELPVDLLKPLKAQGTFKVGQILIAGVTLTDFSAGINVRDGNARFAPLKAQLYGGQYSGDIGIDMRRDTPRLTMDETMSGIDVARLMKDFADTERLTGKGTLTMKLTADGRRGDELVKTLRGRIAANLADGGVEGIDLWYAIAQAQSLIEKRTLAPGENKKRTAFDTFQASADVVDGVATTKDLTVASQLLRVTGEGSSNLVNGTLDYRVTATVLKTPPGGDATMAPLVRAAIPVKITGSFDDPKVRPDLEGMVKARVKQEVEEKKEEVKEKVKEKVQESLRRLFN